MQPETNGHTEAKRPNRQALLTKSWVFFAAFGGAVFGPLGTGFALESLGLSFFFFKGRSNELMESWKGLGNSSANSLDIFAPADLDFLIGNLRRVWCCVRG